MATVGSAARVRPQSDARSQILPAAVAAPGIRATPLPASNCGRRVGILIVAYNAVTTLSRVLRRIPADVWENVEEVVVFDDASADDTYELAVGYKTLSATEKLTVIRNPANVGYGGNQKLGYRYFIDKGFDAVVLLHGDGQYAPECLAQMYAPVVRGEADAVFGSRMTGEYGGPLKGGMPLYKYVGNRILTFCENRALGMDLSEFHSGYRAYSLAALRQIRLDAMTDDFHFDTEIIIKMRHQGFRIAETPIPTYYGDEICYVNGMRYARDVMRALSRYRRTVRSVERFPEFEEYFRPYPLKASRGSSHDQVLGMVGEGRDILDLGCAGGDFASLLNDRGNRVVGVDQHAPDEARRQVFDAFVAGRLDQGLDFLRPALGERTFDRVLLLDVLEHVPEPGRLLAECKPLLRPGALAVVSLPNVANVTVRWSMLWGRFEYTERGILDRTHLRFFTRRSARQLLRDAGFEIVEERATVMPVELALGLSPDSFSMRVLNRVLALAARLLPGLFGYQHILVGRLPRPADARI
jgi:glycosyltransferase involved in cell wall biosynthesis